MKAYFPVVTSHTKVMFLLILVVVIGLFLRVNDLGSESIWVDEAFTYHYTTLSYEELFDILITNDVHPPGFYIIENSFVSVFGTSEFSLRFVPMFFGVISVIMMFFFVREMFGFKEGILGALFFSLSSVLIYYSQEAKMYSMFMFFFLFSLYFFVTLLKDSSFRNVGFLILGNTALLCTHVLGYLVIVAEIFVYLVVYYVNKVHGLKWFGCTASIRKLLLLILGMFMLYLPWIPFVYVQVSWLLSTILSLKFQYKFGFDGFTYLLWFAIICSLVFVMVVFVMLRKKKVVKWIESFKVSNLTFALIFVGFLLFSLFFRDFLFSNSPLIRYSHFTLPLLYLFFSRKMFDLKKLFPVLLFLYLVISSFVLVTYYTEDIKEQWRETASFIDHTDGIMLHTASHTWWAFNYYYTGGLDQLRLHETSDTILIPPFIEGKDTVHLILSHNYATGDFFVKEMNKEYSLRNVEEFVDITVYTYDTHNN
ncbi:hypothetical protein HOL21_03540 [Candidatus Woesearchaeota archaeon]|jgi:mannosyltransferase|nr:hypothetical protein [Candidatus Woesearchaeota archaeon]MBT5397260.1 hypothetical protein [Candidatus Woesearchaeota archaeon]MBT5924410.1 hypothetical protein [Candidatus Woesearchaeota archaeon]MBT7762660.1 hypothetical protein [Candidatus Woesearchaeota archaeon]